MQLVDPREFADVWFLTGPTASGKSAVGIHLARLLDAEILSLDSMAVYRGMDIGTAKPTSEERAAVPHHLLDVAEPWEPFSLAQYVAIAREKVAEIHARGKRALFVGGSSLYLVALIRGLAEGPPPDEELRERLRERARAGESLHALLAAVDPASASRLSPGDERRLIRALEVLELTGRTITQWQEEAAWSRPPAHRRVFQLRWPRDQLYARINARVTAMFQAGLVDEVRALLASGRSLSRTAAQAVGYREVLDHLEAIRKAGPSPVILCSTIESVQLRTRRFSRRQATWFRRLTECRAIPLEEPLVPEQVAAQIRALGEGAE